jgi:carboxyl-terminal processing protease
VVKLTVRKPDGSIVIIPIIRDVVILEETYAKSAILSHSKAKGKFGYINLPSFYADFSNSRGGRNCFEDMRKEIQKLKAEGIKEIVLDLRNNGGGSLQDVVKIGGLFIDQGPVVQVKTREGSPIVLEDPNPGVEFDGKLVVMTNFFSASASEILAAALQDYKRAVIVGSNQTYGKGTVQKMTDLSHTGFSITSLSERPTGTVKLTTQKFYRINGGATQRRGVQPDVILPDVYDKLEVGEQELDYVMDWDQTTAARYNMWNKKPDAKKMAIESRARVAKNPYFQFVSKESEKLKQRQDASVYPLDIKSYQKLQASFKETEDKSTTFNKNITGFEATSLTANQELNKTNLARQEVEKGFIQRIVKDYYLEEALLILSSL